MPIDKRANTPVISDILTAILLTWRMEQYGFYSVQSTTNILGETCPHPDNLRQSPLKGFLFENKKIFFFYVFPSQD